MRTLLWNVLLALAWAAATGPTASNLLTGFVLGYLILWASPRREQAPHYFSRLARALEFLGFFLKELVVATLRISYDVVTPTHLMRPAVLAIPLRASTPWEITLLSIVISLTPGTLVLDVSEDRTILYVHVMYAIHPDAVRRSIQEGFERRILELLR